MYFVRTHGRTSVHLSVVPSVCGRVSSARLNFEKKKNEFYYALCSICFNSKCSDWF